jgi:uncharacterized protein YcfL
MIMKKLFVMLSVAALFLVACNNEVKETEVVNADTTVVEQVDSVSVVDTIKVDTLKVVK